MTALAQGHPGFITSVRVPFVSARARLERFPLSILQLGMRIGIGAVFFKSGLLKINSWEFAVKQFQDEYKVPLLDPVFAAQVTAFVELTVPVFLFLGLAPPSRHSHCSGWCLSSRRSYTRRLGPSTCYGHRSLSIF